jgi:hypothetical protein
MSDHEEERRVKARHDVTQYYQRRSFKRIVSRQDLLRGGGPTPQRTPLVPMMKRRRLMYLLLEAEVRELQVVVVAGQ